MAHTNKDNTDSVESKVLKGKMNKNNRRIQQGYSRLSYNSVRDSSFDLDDLDHLDEDEFEKFTKYGKR